MWLVVSAEGEGGWEGVEGWLLAYEGLMDDLLLDKLKGLATHHHDDKKQEQVGR